MRVAPLTEAFNAAFGTDEKQTTIKSALSRHGITCGRTGHYEKGSVPVNKGTKGVMKSNRTSFKKGHQNPNLKPLGDERICRKDGYILVKVAQRNPATGGPTCYLPKHRVVWEAAHGPVPVGRVVAFKDGNKLRCELDNLVLMTRGELLYFNQTGLSQHTDDLRETGINIAKLAVKANSLLTKRK